MSATILCLAFCVSDVMNKVSMWGTSVYYAMTQPFPALHIESWPTLYLLSINKDATNMAVSWGAQMQSKESTSVG